MDAALLKAEQPQLQAAQAGTHIQETLTILSTTGDIQYLQRMTPELLLVRFTVYILVVTQVVGIVPEVTGLKYHKY
jgi:hypothetical protein